MKNEEEDEVMPHYDEVLSNENGSIARIIFFSKE